MICDVDRGAQSDVSGDIRHVNAPDIGGSANDDRTGYGLVCRIGALGKDGIITLVQDPDSEDVTITIYLLLLFLWLFRNGGGYGIQERVD